MLVVDGDRLGQRAEDRVEPPPGRLGRSRAATACAAERRAGPRLGAQHRQRAADATIEQRSAWPKVKKWSFQAPLDDRERQRERHDQGHGRGALDERERQRGQQVDRRERLVAHQVGADESDLHDERDEEPGVMA